MYRYETHAHTKESSLCGHIAASEGLRLYRDAGYQGVVFTDHFNQENLDAYGGLSWEEKIDRYLAGYRNAAAIADDLGMDVFWGIELRLSENDNDYLVYGVTETFLKAHADMFCWSITDFMHSIASLEDVLVYQAHPFREGCKPLVPIVVDGFEVYNGNPRHDSRNGTAERVAKEHHLLALSGSDFHRLEDLASGGIMLSKRVTSMTEFVLAARALHWSSLIRKGSL